VLGCHWGDEGGCAVSDALWILHPTTIELVDLFVNGRCLQAQAVGSAKSASTAPREYRARAVRVVRAMARLDTEGQLVGSQRHG
jgi:hypothetical protein